MPEFWNRLSPPAQEWLNAALIFAAFLAGALLVRLLWRTLVSRLVSRTTSDFDEVILTPLRRLAVWTVVLAGVYFGLSSLTSTHESPILKPILDKGFGIVWAVLAIACALKIFGLLINLKIHQAPEPKYDTETRLAFIRKLVTALVWVIGALYILHAAGVDTSPLLAGGAVGGLVLGLALQETLSNVFAGFFMNIDRPVKIGDLVKLEQGQEGFVEEIGWRYTKLRLWSNSLVVVPNSKLSQSILTNFNLPVDTTSVYVNAGVSYDCDLDRVEAVVAEEAKAVQAEFPGADRGWEPAVRFKEFAESAVTFMAVLRAADPADQYKLQSEFIKRLHRRFRKEGIEFAQPTRTIVQKPAPNRAN